jgi:hypothetical protein
MPDKTQNPIPPDEQKKFKYPVPADQAEGERNQEKSSKVGHTPGQAEGERETVEQSLRDKERNRDTK